MLFSFLVKYEDVVTWDVLILLRRHRIQSPLSYGEFYKSYSTIVDNLSLVRATFLDISMYFIQPITSSRMKKRKKENSNDEK